MLAFSGLIAMIGVMCFQRALGVTLRANRDTRIPYFGSPVHTPAGTHSLRALGAGLMVFGGVLLALSAWYWLLVVVLLGPVLTFFTIWSHNARVVRAARS